MENHELCMLRVARKEDLVTIVELLADDNLGRTRERCEHPLPQCYIDAFDAIDSDPNIELIVACEGTNVVGVEQITFTPHIVRQGGWRATIEGVRVASTHRGQGIGGKMIAWAIARAKDRHCHMVQLTTDKSRENAKHFYEKLEFIASHEGLKMHLS